MKSPDMTPRKLIVEPDYVRGLLGVDFKDDEIARLLEKMRYGAKVARGKLEVLIPAYRIDVLHPMDIVEDVAIAYGYANFSPEIPRLYSPGKRDPLNRFSMGLGEILQGLSFQEVMSLIMTSERVLFEKMNLPKGNVVRTVNPKSSEHSVARTWVLPSLMEFLEKNKTAEYPQQVYEVGECIRPDGVDERRVAGVIAHSRSNFSEMKAAIMGLFNTLGIEPKVSEGKHGSFIEGRCAKTQYGFFGELAPEVLRNFGLEVPVTAFEFNLTKIFEDLA